MNDNKRYSSHATIPALASGQYTPVVRTRSNVKDFNLTNNIAVASLSDVNLPIINLNENKTIMFRTNQYGYYQLSRFQLGTGINVILTTSYQLAYHQLYIKQNAPPVTNDYDAVSDGLASTKQTVSISNTKSTSCYLLIESASSVPFASN